MIEQQLYVRDKLREHDAASPRPPLIPPPPRDRQRPLARAARAAGRRVRRMGEALEAWGARAPARDARRG